MAIAAIIFWLNQPDKNYQAGVQLYEQYGKSVLLKAFFRNGDSDKHFVRLQSELEELYKTREDITTPPAALKIPTVESMNVPVIRYSLSDDEWNKAPDAIKDLYTHNSKLKSHADLLHHQVALCENDEQRLAIGLAILDDRDKVNENWKNIKDFHSSGVVKEQLITDNVLIVQQMNTSQLLAKLKNLPTYITKAGQRLLELTDEAKKAEVRKRLDNYEVLLDLVKKRLADVV